MSILQVEEQLLERMLRESQLQHQNNISLVEQYGQQPNEQSQQLLTHEQQQQQQQHLTHNINNQHLETERQGQVSVGKNVDPAVQEQS